MDAVTKPKVKDYKANIYTEVQVRKLLTYVKETKLEIPVVLAVGLGLRRGEVYLVYVNKEFIFKSPKSSAGERTLIVPDTILKLLKQHKKKQNENKLSLGNVYKDYNLVCCKEDGSPIIPGSLSREFLQFLRDHDLEEIRFHDLRHTHASLLLKYGIAAKVASTRLGHSSIGITMDLYSHIYSEVEIEAANKIEDGLFKSNAV